MAPDRASREARDRAHGQRRQASRFPLGWDANGSAVERVDDPETGEARHLQRRSAAAPGHGLERSGGRVPRRGVPRAADARRAVAAARRRRRGERVPARSRRAASLGRRRGVAAGDAAHPDPPALRRPLRRLRRFLLCPGRRHRRRAPAQLRRHPSRLEERMALGRGRIARRRVARAEGRRSAAVPSRRQQLTLDAAGTARATVDRPAPCRSAARRAGGARVPRPERRSADEFAHGSDLAGVARRRAARGALRRSGQAARGRGRRARPRRPAAALRRCRRRRLRAPLLRRAQAHGRRLLRLRERRGGAAHRSVLLEPQRWQRPLPLRGAAAGHRRAGAGRAQLRLARPRRRDEPARSTSPGAGDDWFAQGERRPDGRRSREDALRARRHRALPGAHAVPRGDRARHRSSARASPRAS